MPAAQKYGSSRKTKALVFLVIATLFFLGINNLISFTEKKRVHKPSVLGEKTSSQANKIVQLEKIVGENPDYLPAVIELARIYKKEGQEEMCMKYLKKAIEIDSNSIEVVNFKY